MAELEYAVLQINRQLADGSLEPAAEFAERAERDANLLAADGWTLVNTIPINESASTVGLWLWFSREWIGPPRIGRAVGDAQL